MNKKFIVTAIFLCAITVFSQEQDSTAGSAPLQQKSEAPDSTDARIEIFGYSSSENGYQLLNPPAKKLNKQFITESPQKSPGTTAGHSAYSTLPLAPDRPIGKTIAGIILSIQGGASTILGMITLMVGATSGSDNAFLNALPVLGPGLGMLIPGSAMVSQARSEWAYYNEWEGKYGKQTFVQPAFTMQYTWVF